MNITHLVVKNDYCIGCGVCAGICPSHNLHMDWSPEGELIPYAADNCKDNCSVCLDVCPFYDHELNQDDIADTQFEEIPGIKYDDYIGHFLNCNVGWREDGEQRLKCASGGAASALLSALLREKIVDKVVAVGQSPSSERIFEYKILLNPEDVLSTTGSAYYPVEISKILQTIIKEKEENYYAIIALPCVVYALRLAMNKIPKLKRKIKIIASLTCTQLPNRFYSEFLAVESGIPVSNLLRMDFRRKVEGKCASDFNQIAITKNGEEGKPLPNPGLPHHLFYYHYFKQNACNFCDDVFGELSDITFMDAWLQEYIKDYRGTSLIITRLPLAGEVLENSSKLYLKKIDAKSVMESQMGVIYKKRVLLKGRIFKKNNFQEWYPKKRLEPDLDVYKKNREFLELTDKIQHLSKKLWPYYHKKVSNSKFWEEMNDLEVEIKRYERKEAIKNYFKIPARFLQKILQRN